MKPDAPKADKTDSSAPGGTRHVHGVVLYADLLNSFVWFLYHTHEHPCPAFGTSNGRTCTYRLGSVSNSSSLKDSLYVVGVIVNHKQTRTKSTINLEFTAYHRARESPARKNVTRGTNQITPVILFYHFASRPLALFLSRIKDSIKREAIKVLERVCRPPAVYRQTFAFMRCYAGQYTQALDFLLMELSHVSIAVLIYGSLRSGFYRECYSVSVTLTLLPTKPVDFLLMELSHVLIAVLIYGSLRSGFYRECYSGSVTLTLLPTKPVDFLLMELSHVSIAVLIYGSLRSGFYRECYSGSVTLTLLPTKPVDFLLMKLSHVSIAVLNYGSLRSGFYRECYSGSVTLTLLPTKPVDFLLMELSHVSIAVLIYGSLRSGFYRVLQRLRNSQLCYSLNR
ncbi:hypothetical protein J6590_042048 [Homalodisca vitripennis]|nr:hypothetical protein J6590_042048 [Homalodisca vitripennis]